METAKKLKLVIIGNGMAGTAALEEMLEREAEHYEITVIGAERHPNYNRVLLAQVLTGAKGIGEIALHERSWYEDNSVELITGVRVTGINRAGRTLALDDGSVRGYDRLVLSTGSVPVVPDLPGALGPRVVGFRDIDDCERIGGILGEKPVTKRAVVIGGGILGLEAAHAIAELGADVTVVHLADRLMERQLDTTAAALLKGNIEALGIRVLLGAETIGIDELDDGALLRLADGNSIETDIVVMSIGIRPNIKLAESSGIYCRRGIVVSDTMQTYDPAVYAVGECVEHRGVTFGLVAPLFEQARVLADHLAGHSRLIFRSGPTQTRLKIPGIELFSAGEVADVSDGDGTETLEYLDRGEGLYKKVAIRDGRITGVLLYGDTTEGPGLFQSLVDGVDISGRRRSLLTGAPAAGSSSVDAMPESAIVCGCNGITKGMIVEAVTAKGLFTREDVKRETGATGSCGGCAALVDRILEATLGPVFQNAGADISLCDCTHYSREDVVKNIRERGLMSVVEVMETLGWETVGCETCRPAINYYLQMSWPAGATDDPGSRLINEREHANIQADGTFSVVPRIYGGVVRPDELRRIADAAERFDATLVKVTGGQRIGLYGIRKEDLPAIWEAVGMPSGYAYAKALRTVKTCVGSAHCRYGTQDSLGLGIRLEKMLERLWTPAKLKLGVNGCPRSCAESAIKDVGITGVAGGWEVRVGGCGGVELKAAVPLATITGPDEAVEVVAAFVQLYREEAAYGERVFRWIEKTGIERVRAMVVDDIDARRALVERLCEATAATVNPWEAKLSSVPAAG